MLDGIPYGFNVVRIAEPRANAISRWRSNDSGDVLEATPERIAAVLSNKTPLVRRYRKRAPRVWLLIACAFTEFANNFYVSSGVKDWRFDFEFDKVLLLTSEQGVLDLQHRDS